MPSYALLIPVEEEHRSEPLRAVPEPKKSTSLLVEDERTPREEISGLLEKRNFKVRPAQSGREAIDLANEIGPSVVLMDIDLGGDDFDGITAAGEILRLQPASSVIFITAHFNNPDYRERVEQSGLRTAGWIEKPITRQRLEALTRVIRKEAKKVEVRVSVERAISENIEPYDHVRSLALWDKSISSEVTRELIDELETGSSRIHDANVDTEIRRLYAEIRSLAVRSHEDPSLKGQIEPLKARLRALQEEEANDAEERFDARLHLKPGSGLHALELAKRLAGR